MKMTPKNAAKVFGLILEMITLDELKKTYKILSMKYHPDREGGSHDKMQELQSAYDTLKKYLSGDYFDPELLSSLAAIFTGILKNEDSPNMMWHDPLELVKTNLDQSLRSERNSIKKARHESIKIKKKVKRFNTKKYGTKIRDIMEYELRKPHVMAMLNHRRAIAQIKRLIEVANNVSWEDIEGEDEHPNHGLFFRRSNF